MTNGNKNGQVLSELQQLRSIVLGEYTVEVDQRLQDLEVQFKQAQVDLTRAIDDANTLGSNEIQAVRDLIDEKIEKMHFYQAAPERGTILSHLWYRTSQAKEVTHSQGIIRIPNTPT